MSRSKCEKKRLNTEKTKYEGINYLILENNCGLDVREQAISPLLVDEGRVC